MTPNPTDAIERLDIQRIRDYCDKATAGPWYQHPGRDGEVREGPWVGTGQHGGMFVCGCATDKAGDGVKDSHFIANARTDLPACLNELASLREQVERLEQRLCIDPGGSDKIDELESAMGHLRHELSQAREALVMAQRNYRRTHAKNTDELATLWTPYDAALSSPSLEKNL